MTDRNLENFFKLICWESESYLSLPPLFEGTVLGVGRTENDKSFLTVQANKIWIGWFGACIFAVRF